MLIQRRSILLVVGCLAICATSPPVFSASAPMNEQQFWQLIDAVKNEAGTRIESRPAVLQKHLSFLDPEAIQSFQQRYEALLLKANRWSLWGAASLMNGGCSDDGFKYFRDWLISEGEKTFKEPLAKPDSLASFPRRDFFELELFGYAALKAYAAKGAGELERDFKVEYAVTEGIEWQEADLPQLFPALAAKYPRR
ncbi:MULTISPECIES: DUF4240 domain-containing protein [unclassified Duganella]|uniref:DUF4240 domain-containing protein n=1 Tax=unclassified Duganella TaxID=2636909 RepID=UPI0018F2C325|nr:MULTISPECIES: DUF4240 domain-containing protein [unclassified Duganella]